MKKLIAVLIVIGITACASYKPLPPTQSDADRASQKYPGITLTDLNEGKSIFEHSCHKCHSLKKPFKKSEADIEHILPSMAKKAKLDSKQQDLVLKYLVAMNSTKK